MNAFILREVTAGYTDKTVLRSLNASFAKGERVAVMGPSGCGKTTLLRLLLGLLTPFSGTVEGAGRWRCGTVFQEDRLCEQLGALRNVALVCRKTEQAALRRQLAALGLEEDEQAKPVSQLSGGQRRRVALVRALAFPSDFVLLDEPFKGLDDAAKAQAMAFLQSELGDRGLVLVTHDAAEAAALCDRVLQLPAISV